jgi:hypothetical protein
MKMVIIYPVYLLIVSLNTYILEFKNRFKIDSIYASKLWIQNNIPNGSKIILDGGYVPRLLKSDSQIYNMYLQNSKFDKSQGKRYKIELNMKKKHYYYIDYIKFKTQDLISNYSLNEKNVIKQNSNVYNLDEYKKMGFTYLLISSNYYERFFQDSNYKSIGDYYKSILTSQNTKYIFDSSSGFKGGIVTIVKL